MSDIRFSDNDASRRDIPSFIEPRPPLISNPFMRPKPQKGTNLLELFEEDSECEEPELVQVYLRLKPCNIPSNLYEVRSDRCLITSLDTTTAGHGRRTQHNVSKMYTFSHIFRPDSTQKEIFENVVKDNLKKLPEGHSFTLLTYGASGSGKTYTLMGTVASPGLVPRSLEYVFKVVDVAQQPLFKPAEGGGERLNYAEQDYELQWVKRLRQISAPLRDKYRRMSAQLCTDLTTSNLDLSNRTSHYVWVSFIEIYNEGIYDLLSTSDRKNASKLAIREDSNGNVYVKGATQAFVRSGEEAYDVMVAGKHNLQVAATGVHAQSSRSHCIFTITMLTETDEGIRASCVRLCDLAGCERQARTRNTGVRMAESRAINSSLHVLERCLHTLRKASVSNAKRLVPYRESKLTRLLGAGLSGARGEAVSMVVTLNPAPQYAHETRHVLQLAAVARNIQINNTISEYPSSLESSTQDSTISFNGEIMKLRADNERLHFELVQAQARNKELQACMEERQAAAADAMREVVDEAQAITKQYYEAQIQALRAEMDEMAEEYESRLSKTVPALGENTPTRSMQNKITQLLTDIAILEEKLTAEQLARARAEEEVQHLRACIEERDEKALEESPDNEDVMSLTDESDHEDEDPCNESLEPTFKKEDINRSRLILQTMAEEHNSFISEHSIDNANDSVLEKSGDTLKDTDRTNDSNDCTYETGEDCSAASNKVENEIKENSEIITDVNTDNSPKSGESVRGTYFVRCSDISDVIPDVDNSEKSSSLGRGTYCVSEPKDNTISDSEIKVLDETSHSEKADSKDSLLDTEEIDDVSLTPLDNKPDTFVNKIIKSIKASSESSSNNSLAHFEKLEMATKDNDDNTKLNLTEEFSNIKILKEKRTYFDDETTAETPEAPRTVIKAKEKKTYFDTTDVKEPLKTDLHLKTKMDDYRSPSIVKEEATSDFTPSMIKKLLGKSVVTHSENINSIQKMKLCTKTHDSIDVFEGMDSPQILNKITDNPEIIEQVRKSIENVSFKEKVDDKPVTEIIKELPLDEEKEKSPQIALNEEKQKETLKKMSESTKELENDILQKSQTEFDAIEKDINDKLKLESQNMTKDESQLQVNKSKDNTIEEFENIYKDITAPRATEFDLLVSQESQDNPEENVMKNNNVEFSETEKIKYNLRHKSKSEKPKTEVKRGRNKYFGDEILMESLSKCESKPKPARRNLRLRRHKNQSEEDCDSEKDDKLKDIANLQTEFSDVTMNMPAPVKATKDIPSPEKVTDEENLPPMFGIQSCPSKSVTRSRRKLFTPRAEPLDESLGQTGDSTERIRVPRPSYHRPRARRKL